MLTGIAAAMTTAFFLAGCSKSAKSNDGGEPGAGSPGAARWIVERNEIVTEPLASPLNFAGVMIFWASGSSIVVPVKDEIYVSVLEGNPDKRPYLNSRWQLWRRDAKGVWSEVVNQGEFAEREPCMIGALRDGSLLISGHPLAEIDEAAVNERLRKQGVTSVVALAEPPAIDGDLTSWRDLPATSNRLVDRQTTHRATLRFACDARHLYLAASVADPTPAIDHPGKADELWRGDALELYLSGNRRHAQWKPGDHTIHLPATKRSGAVAAVFDNVTGKAGFEPRIRLATRIWPDGAGYDLEAAIPLDVVGLTGLTVGEEFALEWDVCYEKDGNFWTKLLRHDRVNNQVTAIPLDWGIARVSSADGGSPTGAWRWFAGAGESPRSDATNRPAEGTLPPMSGACDPTLYVIRREGGQWQATTAKPVWPENSYFTDHSYRGFAVDADSGTVLMTAQDLSTLALDNHGNTAQSVSWRDAHGRWHPIGRLQFPLRGCYPAAALRRGTAHVVAVADIVEPVEAWRQAKFKATGKTLDFAFRQMFYTWTPEIGRQPFSPPLVLDNVEDTGGDVRGHDLLIDASGAAHVVYQRRRFSSPVIQNEFFPGQPDRSETVYVKIVDGKVVRREVIAAREQVRGEAGTPWKWEGGMEPGGARLAQGRDGRMFVLHSLASVTDGKTTAAVNYVTTIHADGAIDAPVALPLPDPLSFMQCNTTRNGAEPADAIDIVGFGALDSPRPRADGKGDARPLRYVRVTLRTP